MNLNARGKGLIDYLMRYAFSSACAVGFEFLLYFALVHFYAVSPFTANIISSGCAVVIVWFISGKYLFASHRITWAGYLTWYVYQFFAILAYSALVALLVRLGVNYLVSKVIVIFISFTINSIFFKRVVLKKKEPTIEDTPH